MPADLGAARAAAEQFRAQYIRGQPFEDRVPLDVVFIADNVLRLDLIDFSGLENEIGSSAYVTASLKEMYVDEALMSSYNVVSAPNWVKDRLRFSVAHELGHIWMHRALVPKIRCKEIADLKALFNCSEPWFGDVEKEANEFAGRLIANREDLELALNAYGASQSDPRWRDSSELRSRFCELYGARIGLNAKGMDARLNREELWPDEWVN